MEIFCSIWSVDRFEILQGGIVRTVTATVSWKRAAGDRLLLWFVTTSLTTGHQGKQLYLAVQWKNTHTVPTWLDCSGSFTAWLSATKWTIPIWWDSQFHNNLISWVNIYQQLHPVVYYRTPCWPSLTDDTLKRFTGCKHKSFTLMVRIYLIL